MGMGPWMKIDFIAPKSPEGDFIMFILPIF